MKTLNVERVVDRNEQMRFRDRSEWERYIDYIKSEMCLQLAKELSKVVEIEESSRDYDVAIAYRMQVRILEGNEVPVPAAREYRIEPRNMGKSSALDAMTYMAPVVIPMPDFMQAEKMQMSVMDEIRRLGLTKPAPPPPTKNPEPVKSRNPGVTEMLELGVRKIMMRGPESA